jgi:HEAT repeat protein
MNGRPPADDESFDREDALALARDGDVEGIHMIVEHIRNRCDWAARHQESADSIEKRWDPSNSEDQIVYDQLRVSDYRHASRTVTAEAQEIAVALADTGHPLALATIEEMAKDDDAAVREIASFALASSGGPRSVAPLLGVLRHAVVARDRKLIDKTTRSLERVGASGAQELAAGLKDDNSIVRWTAATIMATVGDQAVVPALSAVAANDPDDAVRDAAAVALERIAERQQEGE